MTNEYQRQTVHLVAPMGTFERVFHWTAMIFTAGLWWPIYRAARKAHGEVR